MKKLIVTILFVWLSVGVFSKSWAQGSEMEYYAPAFAHPYKKPPHAYFGILSSLNFGQLSSYTPGDLNGNPLITGEHNIHIGYSLGARMVYLLGYVKNSKSRISADVLFERQVFDYTAHGSVTSLTNQPVPGSYILLSTSSSLSLQLTYDFTIPGLKVGIFGGISGAYRVRHEQTYRVSASEPIAPSASVIDTSDSGRTLTYSAPAMNTVQFGILGGLRYDILIRKSILTPFAQFDYGVNGMLSGEKVLPMIFRVGCAWIFGL
ncbi:MAG: hypothetical protein IPM69_16335 [Ignavibacteria bacterium]|nr:hypothetical protein [Ignavibacteria bacterium]